MNKNINFETIIAIKDELVNFKGSDPLIIKADNNGYDQRILASPNFWTNATNDLTQTLEKKFKDLITININSLE